MDVGLTEAAELTGKSPSTLTRSVNAGRLSVTAGADGARLFNIAELERVYGRLRTPGEARTGAEDGASAPSRSELHEALDEARQREIDGYRERLRLIGEMLEETRKERDRWQEQAGQITNSQHDNSVMGLQRKLDADPDFRRVSLADAKPGDVVSMKTPGGQHVVMFAGWKDGKPQFIGSNNVNSDGSQRISMTSMNYPIMAIHQHRG